MTRSERIEALERMLDDLAAKYGTQARSAGSRTEKLRMEGMSMGLNLASRSVADMLAVLASEEVSKAGRFRLEGKGLIDTEGALDRCTGCGQLPPHEGCKAICAACAPPTGACVCVGCSIHAQGFRAGVEAAAKDCEREAEACIDVAQALDLDEEDGDQVFAQNILLDQAGRIRLLSPPSPSTPADDKETP